MWPVNGIFWSIYHEILVYATAYTSHIQRSPAEIVDRPNVAEFQIRRGVERIFCLKCIPCHILGRGSETDDYYEFSLTIKQIKLYTIQILTKIIDKEYNNHWLA